MNNKLDLEIIELDSIESPLGFWEGVGIGLGVGTVIGIGIAIT